MELMGRFGRAPVQVQHPQVLNRTLSDPTRKDADQRLTCQPYRYELYVRRPFHTRVLLQEQAASRCCYYVRRRYKCGMVNIRDGAVAINAEKDPPDFQLGGVAKILVAFCSSDLLGFKTEQGGICRNGTHPQPVTLVVDGVCRICQGVADRQQYRIRISS